MNNFDCENFLLDILDTDWDSTIAPDDANLSFNQFLNRINVILDKYMPLKKLSNEEYKRRYKPWVSNDILNTINRKNKLYNKYTKNKNPMVKEQIFTEYKALRNNVNELLSRKSYY